MDSNPYLLDLPAVVSFSGGRTSGYMLAKILEAYGGKLPDGLRVSFQNTGLEHAATYDFIRDVERRWAVPVTWLEYCVSAKNQHAYRVVDFDTASRDGEPFTALIQKKGFLPNPVARICTANLKMRVLDRHLRTMPGFADGYTNAVGLRYDEPRRALRIRSDNARETMYCPMYHAKHTEADVLAWWKEQPFDLLLPGVGNSAGNCVGCFLKGRHKLGILMQEMPEHFDWWVRAEELSLNSAKSGARFRSDRDSYRKMLSQTKAQGLLWKAEEDDTVPCMCTD